MCRAVISAFVNWSKPAQPRRLNKRKRVQSPHLLQSNYRKINASRKYWKSWNIINKKSITDQRDLGFFVVSRYAYKIHTQFHFTFTIQFIRLRYVFFFILCVGQCFGATRKIIGAIVGCVGCTAAITTVVGAHFANACNASIFDCFADCHSEWR